MSSKIFTEVYHTAKLEKSISHLEIYSVALPMGSVELYLVENTGSNNHPSHEWVRLTVCLNRNELHRLLGSANTLLNTIETLG